MEHSFDRERLLRALLLLAAMVMALFTLVCLVYGLLGVRAALGLD